jgi:putative tryptophan/tyrosine transport system substrate-binding protein
MSLVRSSAERTPWSCGLVSASHRLAWVLLVVALGSPARAETAVTPFLKPLALVGYASRTAAPDFSGRTVDARGVSTKDLRGRVVLINFWASWCIDCRPEMPLLERLHRELAPQGLAVVGVNAREEGQAVRRHAGQLGLTFPLVLDPDGKINALYGVVGVPTTFLIARDGRAVGPPRRASRVGEPTSPRAPASAAGRAGAGRALMRLRLSLLVFGIVLAVHAVTGGAAEAQRAARPVQIGALTESWGPTPAIIGLRDGLHALGYREDKDFTIGVRFTQGESAELLAAARELVRRGADIIVTTEGANTARAAQLATGQLPIVFIGGGDPVESGLVKSLARPGGNLTGIASLDAELAPKRLEIFRELVPRLRRVLFVYDATGTYAVGHVEAYRAAARRLGLTLVERPVRSQDEAGAVIGGLRRGEVDGILAPRFLSLNIPGFILDIAPKGTFPTMFQASFFAERGGLASYGATDADLGRQAARLVDRILKGAKPADLPVEQPTKFELVINLKTAKALGLTIPPSLQQRADRLIQ